MSHQVQQDSAQRVSHAKKLRERLHAVICIQAFYRKRQACAELQTRLARLAATPQIRKEGDVIALVTGQENQKINTTAQNKSKHVVETQVNSASLIKLGAWRGPIDYPELRPLFQALWRQKLDEEKKARAVLQSLTKEQRQLNHKISKTEVHTIHPYLFFLLIS